MLNCSNSDKSWSFRPELFHELWEDIYSFAPLLENPLKQKCALEELLIADLWSHPSFPQPTAEAGRSDSESEAKSSPHRASRKVNTAYW